MRIGEIIYSTVNNRCPRCHKGKVFLKANPYIFSELSKMHESCSTCDLKYEREPGFFYGSMYVSYALMAGIFITWFVADLLWFNLNAMVLALSVTGTIVVLAPLVFRWSRLIWLNFFVRYEKNKNYHLKILKDDSVPTTENKTMLQKLK